MTERKLRDKMQFSLSFLRTVWSGGDHSHVRVSVSERGLGGRGWKGRARASERKSAARGHPRIEIFQNSIFWLWSHWSELEMWMQRSPTKPSIVWNFQKISRSNLRLPDPWQERSLYSSRCRHFICWTIFQICTSRWQTWVFIMCTWIGNLQALTKSTIWNIIFNFPA